MLKITKQELSLHHQPFLYMPECNSRLFVQQNELLR